MDELYIPVISDITYMSSCWYNEIITGMRNSARQQHIKIRPISDTELKSELDSIPPVVVLTGAAFPSIDLLKEAGKRIVVAGANASQFGADISCVTSDRVEDTRILIRYFSQCGKNRIALVGFRTDSFHDMERYYAALNSYITLKAFINDNDVFFTGDNLEDCFNDFLPLAKDYEAIICPNDATALCFIKYCRYNGIRIPEDLYVASFANMKIGQYSTPSLTSVAIDYESIGMQAYNVWDFIYKNLPRSLVCKMDVPSKLMIRQSTSFAPFDQQSEYESYRSILKDTTVYDRFYADPSIQTMMNIENCLAYRDEIDCQLIIDLFNGMVYEELAEKYFFSVSTIRYRLNKIYQDAGVSSRKEFLQLIRSNLGSKNPFCL
jgi:LacI family transcriptional regulator